MINLYEYDNSSYEDCIDDLGETLLRIEDNLDVDYYSENPEVLERHGIRIQEIAKRLQRIIDIQKDLDA